MHATEVLATLILLLVLIERTNGFVACTADAVSNIFWTVTKYVAGIAYVQGRPPNAKPIAEFRAVQKEQFKRLVFIETSPFYVPILVFGILACIPAPAPTQELAMLVPLLMGFFLLLLFLLQYLLHVGAENASQEAHNKNGEFPHLVPRGPIEQPDVFLRPPRFLA